MLNLETVMMLFPDIFSNKVKTFVFSHCLSSEILLKVQQGKLKFNRRSWEPTSLGGLGLKSFQFIIG